MKITVAKNSGFCFGVKRAYDLACVNSKNCDELYIFGKLVHNDDVCRDLKRRGIKEIKSLGAAKNGTVIFTAHGIGPDAYEKAQSRGMRIIDTTCPKVMKAQRLAKNYAGKNYRVIVFGDKNHTEVKSILKWSENRAIVVGSLERAKKLRIDKRKKYRLISQTTQNVKEFENVKKYFAGKLPDFECFNTICDSTDNRQNEIRKLAKANDAVTVIGGRDSANSKRLYEIAKAINPKTYFIENARQLKKSWFGDIKKVAVSAGASTPKWVINEVISRIGKSQKG
ncbi:MAG: 4-hydroxy-3-methylbut-2-enyl diphosphate reductase [Patescibacteria group bacterium]|nr:4-hydroxy-3-methylbut-2-enyl diphosphate reductase [Patescibacteria group bacterium]